MTAREKALWLRAAAVVALIYSTLYLARFLIDYLRERGLLRLAVGLAFFAAALWLLDAIRRRRPGRREIAVLALAALPFAGLFLVLERAEERLHLLEYGLLGGLVYAALLERTGSGGDSRRPVALWVPVAATVITGLAGWLDEGIQYLLPNRYYDLRDVALNVGAAVLAVGAMYVAGIARRADRAGS